jgi:hypothetical protein
MDRKELAIKLENFKQVCQAKGYITGELYFDEAYLGDSSSSFIVKMIVKKSWMDTMSSTGTALDALIDVLWDTTDAKTRASVHVLSIYNEDERDLLEQPQHREVA